MYNARKIVSRGQTSGQTAFPHIYRVGKGSGAIFYSCFMHLSMLIPTTPAPPGLTSGWRIRFFNRSILTVSLIMRGKWKVTLIGVLLLNIPSCRGH